MRKKLKLLYSLSFAIISLLYGVSAKEGNCTMDDSLKVTSCAYLPAIVDDPQGNDPILGPDGEVLGYLVPILDANGNPVFENGNKKYRLSSPLTLIVVIEGKYTIRHKDGTKEGPFDYPPQDPKFSVPAEIFLPNVNPPESISMRETELVVEDYLETIKAALKKKYCDAHQCNNEEE